MVLFNRLISLACTLVFSGVLSALTIQLDYGYDTNDFFEQPGAKEAMRAVADYFEERIQDNLLAIDPAEFGGSSTWTANFRHPGTLNTAFITDMVVPEGVIIVFVGGSNIGSLGRGGPGGFSASGSSQAWLDRVGARGQIGALADPVTDFAPWGGSLTFNNSVTWNFSTTGRPTGSNPDFVAVALHEMGHLLGIGTAASWNNWIDGSTDLFEGPLSMLAFGGQPVPVQSGGGHWQDDGACVGPDGFNPNNPNNVLSRSYRSFGTSHGNDQIALMDPISCTVTNRTTLNVFTDLDWAGLADIGWEVQMPLQLDVLALGPGLAEFTWPSTTGQSYQLQRSVDLRDWTNLTSSTGGDGTLFAHNDNNAPADRAFYRLVDTSAADAPLMVSALGEPADADDDGVFKTISVDPVWVDSCGSCSNHSNVQD